MVVQGKISRYEVIKRIGHDRSMNYYVCQNEVEEWLILAIAVTMEQNGDVDRVSYLLKRTAIGSDETEREYAEQTQNSNKLHYDWLFPQVVESFILQEQGQRNIVILRFLDANLRKSFALKQIVDNKQRVDLKTSAWIMGRMLKLLGFLHENRILTPIWLNSFLLEPENHRLLMLEWTDATLSMQVTKAQSCMAIRQAAECTMTLLDVQCFDNGWKYPYPIAEGELRYIILLQEMQRGEYYDAYEAHREFYALIGELWGRKYHPFTTYDRISD